jgi:hypothetical protein
MEDTHTHTHTHNVRVSFEDKKNINKPEDFKLCHCNTGTM